MSATGTVPAQPPERHADLLVRGGTVITPSGSERIDVACVDGRIVALGNLQGVWSADTTLDAAGLHVLPGVIDSWVHFREPGLTHKKTLEAGTRGAVLGGVTAVFELPNTNPLTLDAADLQAKLDAAVGRTWCDDAFYIGGSAVNAERLAALENLPGCAGVKAFMGSSFGDLLADDDDVLRRILRHGRRRMAVHAEDEARLRERKALAEASGEVRQHPHWRDVDSALLATQRIVRLAEETGRRLHILHVSTAEEIAFLAARKRRLTVEVTPHHLSLHAPDCYERLGSLVQMNPPVRERHHQEALWQAIRDGVVDVVGSDHAPHTLLEKARPYPQSASGITGVQTLLPVMLDHVHAGRLSLQRLVDLTSAGPARIFGIEGKGRIALGYNADFSIVDLQARRVIRNDWIASVSGWTPYDARAVTGWPIHTVVRGEDSQRRDGAFWRARRGRGGGVRPLTLSPAGPVRRKPDPDRPPTRRYSLPNSAPISVPRRAAAASASANSPERSRASITASAAAVVPPLEVTRSRNTDGGSSERAASSAAPRKVAIVRRRAWSASRPSAIPAASIASITRNTYAGPLPLTAVTTSSRLSSLTQTTSPTALRIRSASARSSVRDASKSARPVTPRPISAGVFGMLRTMRRCPPSQRERSLERMPAATLTTSGPLNKAAIESATSRICCGLTARTTISAESNAAEQGAE